MLDCKEYLKTWMLPSQRLKQVMVTLEGSREKRKNKEVQRVKLDWRWATRRSGKFKLQNTFVHIHAHYIYNTKSFVNCKKLKN